MVQEGDVSRCMKCGGKIIAISDPRQISLTAGLWVHLNGFRRAFGTHVPVPPRGL